MTRFGLRALGFLGGVMLLSSCTLMFPRQAPPVETEPATEQVGIEPVVESAVEPILEPVVEPAPPPAPAASDGPVRTAVVLSDAIPEYAQIAAELVRRGTDQVTVYYVSVQPGHDSGVVAEIERADPDRIIAVGLPAAILARRIPGKPMVFCQAYNYQDHDLVSATSKGVHLLPPFDLQLEAWRAVAPNLRHIGVITGPGHDERIAEMRRAATAFDAILAVRTVQSDQEALLAFQELAPSIEGLWLLPDNRILSPDVVKEILWYSAKHGTQIATFSERMLEQGALLSSTSVPGDVVDRILARFDDVDSDGRLRGPGVLGLTAVQTTVNQRLAARLGLKLPERLAQSR
ncbi:MAG TPA: hypothetical protein VKA43_14335 [Gammaproteobacteria bacterium]|nr:hypothetical protein [Gammaproteobacteria bacterium]